MCHGSAFPTLSVTSFILASPSSSRSPAGFGLKQMPKAKDDVEQAALKGV
jgi:hypothetical protein